MNRLKREQLLFAWETVGSFLEFIFIIVTVPLIIIFIYIKDKLNKRLYISLSCLSAKRKISQKMKFVK